MKVIDMIDELDVNNKVGTIWIGVNSANVINKSMITSMVTNYHNLYYIYVEDYLDSIDHSIHNQIK